MTQQFWLNLQSAFDLKQAAGELGKKIDLSPNLPFSSAAKLSGGFLEF